MGPLGPSTQLVLLGTSVLMAIPSLMIFLSLVMKPFRQSVGEHRSWLALYLHHACVHARSLGVLHLLWRSRDRSTPRGRLLCMAMAKARNHDLDEVAGFDGSGH
jgi:hypothetical protein